MTSTRACRWCSRTATSPTSTGWALAYAVDQSNGLVRVYHTDGLGSVRAITNRDDRISVIETYETDASGNPTQTQGGISQPFPFTGQQRDAESGLYYLRARMYDPTIGRFLILDPALGGPASPLSLNRYTYVENNPASLFDPSGLASNRAATDNDCMTKVTNSLAGVSVGGYVVNAVCLNTQLVSIAWVMVEEPGSGHIFLVPILLSMDPSRSGGSSGSDPYETAKAGGRNAGLLRTFAGKSAAEIQRAIRSLAARAAEHLDKAANPTKYIADWASKDPREQQGLANFWLKEAATYTEQAQVLEGLLKERGGAP